MQYILSTKEYDSLTPISRLQERNEALEVARKLIISDEKCRQIYYCNDCPIGALLLTDRTSMNYICIRQKHFAK